MDSLKDCPHPLKNKLFLTFIIGAACLFTGITMLLVLNDKTMLFLSIAAFILCIVKAMLFYKALVNKKYETVEGICVGISPKPLRKYKKIRIIDDNGIEASMLLDKQTRIRIGFRYRFYFKETEHLSLGNEFLDTPVSSDCFLGLEELGEYGYISDN